MANKVSFGVYNKNLFVRRCVRTVTSLFWHLIGMIFHTVVEHVHVHPIFVSGSKLDIYNFCASRFAYLVEMKVKVTKQNINYYKCTAASALELSIPFHWMYKSNRTSMIFSPEVSLTLNIKDINFCCHSGNSFLVLRYSMPFSHIFNHSSLDTLPSYKTNKNIQWNYHTYK